MIAALFVATGGCYFGLPDVDPWDVHRDARSYDGPHAVVAHPPCERWGRYWHGGPSVRVRKMKGDDGGCFASALASVLKWGGVLEHPEASHAWRHFGISAPAKRGGWLFCGSVEGLGVAAGFSTWTCCVEQGHYGHRARKATWLYAVLPAYVAPPSLKWAGYVEGAAASESSLRLDEGFHSVEERRRARGTRTTNDAAERMSKTERTATPVPFRDLLLSIARSASASSAEVFYDLD